MAKESQLLRSFIATSDKTYKKVLAKDGRVMHFADGKPIKGTTFNMVSTRYRKFEGQYVSVAIPSDKGPGYERVKISPRESGNLGREMRLARPDVPGTPVDRLKINGEWYDTEDIVELNQTIMERHGSDAVFKYKT